MRCELGAVVADDQRRCGCSGTSGTRPKGASLQSERGEAVQSELTRFLTVPRNGLQWKDAPKAYGPHKTLYNRFIRWSRLGVFDRIFAGLAGEGPKPERIMIDATHLKAHRTAASLLKKGLLPVVSGEPRAA